MNRNNRLKIVVAALALSSVGSLYANTTAMNAIEQGQQMEQAWNHNFSPVKKTGIHAYLFVSLGMPTLALRQYMRETEPYHIPMAIRGFLADNYQKTAHRFWQIMHPKNKAIINNGIAIDPVWFRRFHITAVPALVVESSNNHYSVVYGNVPIQKGLAIIEQKTQYAGVKEMVKQALSGAL